MNALSQLEAAEHRAVDALRRLPTGDPRRAQLQNALAASRLAKARLLAARPDILRKSHPVEFGKAASPIARAAEERPAIDLLKDYFRNPRLIVDGRTLPIYLAMEPGR